LHDSPALHALHAAPFVPHWVDDCDEASTHTLDAQHPVGQAFASHTHTPTELQSSAPQLAHDAPPVPHDAGVCDAKSSQLPVASQQPSGQELTSH
jgi:hypothetical protein